MPAAAAIFPHVVSTVFCGNEGHELPHGNPLQLSVLEVIVILEYNYMSMLNQQESQRQMSSVKPLQLQRRERKKQDRITRVRNIALQLFVDKGFDTVTVDEIAVTADIGRATFFNYFPTKDAVLRSYHFWIYDEIHEFAEGLNGDSGRELFRQYYRLLTRFIEREGDRYRLLHGILNVRADLRDNDQGRYQRVSDHYGRFVATAVEAGELPKDLDQPLFTEMIRDVWQGNLQNWVLKRRPKALEQRMLKKLAILFSIQSDVT